MLVLCDKPLVCRVFFLWGNSVSCRLIVLEGFVGHFARFFQSFFLIVYLFFPTAFFYQFSVGGSGPTLMKEFIRKDNPHHKGMIVVILNCF